MRLVDLNLDTNDLERALEQVSAMGGIEIGYGHHASVHALPGLADAVLRIANGVDGFATYTALSCGPLSSFVGRQVPIVHDMAISDDGGMLMVLVERLFPIDEETEGTAWFATARKLALGQMVDPASLADLEAAQPGFEAFIMALRDETGRLAFDARAENFMMRGLDLVFGDPIGTCLLFDEIERLRLRLPLLDFAISKDSVPVRSAP